MAVIAVIAAGAMGSAVGGALAAGGSRVVTALAGRSEATVQRAAAHGLEDLGDVASAVADADVVLSILPPSDAMGLARDVVAAGLKDGAVYVDCNAVAPQTAVAMGEVLAGAGAVFVDGGIIGGPPQAGKKTDIDATPAKMLAAGDQLIMQSWGRDAADPGKRMERRAHPRGTTAELYRRMLAEMYD